MVSCAFLIASYSLSKVHINIDISVKDNYVHCPPAAGLSTFGAELEDKETFQLHGTNTNKFRTIVTTEQQKQAEKKERKINIRKDQSAAPGIYYIWHSKVRTHLNMCPLCSSLSIVFCFSLMGTTEEDQCFHERMWD